MQVSLESSRHEPRSRTCVRVSLDSDPSVTDGYGRRAVDRLWRRWRQHGWTCPQLNGDLETQRHEKVNAWICARPTTHHDLASEKRKRKKRRRSRIEKKCHCHWEERTPEMIDRHEKRDRHDFFSKNINYRIVVESVHMYIVIIFGRMFIEERFIQVVGQICRLVSCRFRRSQATRRLWVHFTPKSTNAHLLVDRRRLLDSLSQYEHTLKAHNFSVWKDCLSVPFQQRRWRRTAFRPEKLACLILFLSTNTKLRRHLWRSYWACIQKLWYACTAFFSLRCQLFLLRLLCMQKPAASASRAGESCSVRCPNWASTKLNWKTIFCIVRTLEFSCFAPSQINTLLLFLRVSLTDVRTSVVWGVAWRKAVKSRFVCYCVFPCLCLSVRPCFPLFVCVGLPCHRCQKHNQVERLAQVAHLLHDDASVTMRSIEERSLVVKQKEKVASFSVFSQNTNCGSMPNRSFTSEQRTNCERSLCRSVRSKPDQCSILRSRLWPKFGTRGNTSFRSSAWPTNRKNFLDLHFQERKFCAILWNYDLPNQKSETSNE